MAVLSSKQRNSLKVGLDQNLPLIHYIRLGSTRVGVPSSLYYKYLSTLHIWAS
jgi:hypothetical protein